MRYETNVVRGCVGILVLLGMGVTPLAVAAGHDDHAEETGAMLDVAAVQRYVGAVDDALFVGLDVMEADHPEAPRAVSAYLCDGADVSVWLHGSLEGSDATLRADTAMLEVTLAGDRAYGSVSLDGDAARVFAAEAATDEAGLYRPEEPDVRGGWIVLADGRQRGAMRAGGGVAENPTLSLPTLEADTASHGRVGACCCGVVFPCDLACCTPLGGPIEDWQSPAATPSPN